MNIAFLVPPALDGNPVAERIFGCNYGIYPQENIFMLYSATMLKNDGHKVDVIDFPISKRNKADFLNFSKEHTYDVFVFYTVFLAKQTDLIARDILRQNKSNVRFVYVSTEPTASPDDFVADDTIVIRGEPEMCIQDVIRGFADPNLFADIAGVSYMRNGKVCHNHGTSLIDDLDVLPFPDRDLLPSGSYYNPKMSYQPCATLLTSRGCNYNCYFCVPNSLNFAREIEFRRECKRYDKPAVRLRSPQNIIEEFAMLAEKGYKSIFFLDDQFVWGDERTIEICEGIKKYNIEWACLARADKIQNYEVVRAMAEAGCKIVNMGIESFDQAIIDEIQKGCKAEDYYRAVDNVKRAGMEVEINILIGATPLETKETIDATFKKVLELNPDYALFSICTPFPYTIFNMKAKEHGWMIKDQYEPIDPMKESFISYPHLTKPELDKIIRRLYFRYYFRPSFIWKKVKELKSFSDLVNKFKTALTILR